MQQNGSFTRGLGNWNIWKNNLNLGIRHDYTRSTKYGHLTNLHKWKVKRVVAKSGSLNIEKWKSKSRSFVFPDVIKALVDSRWRWTLISCFLTYMFTWLLFAAIWWLILFDHGDFEENHLPDVNNSTTWTPCVRKIYGFVSTFLFSIEIHTTIGYGTRSLTLECPFAILTMCIEGIIGTVMQSFIVGIVFAKLTRPKGRAQTLLFSKNAVINQRDRNMCLVFRVGNVRKSRIIDVSVQAYLIRFKRRSSVAFDNEIINLELLVDSCDDFIFMFPTSVVHIITSASPFYKTTAAEMLRTQLEILVVLEGTIESTGQPVQLRSSYTTREILWGHRFAPTVQYRDDLQGYEVDYSYFDTTEEVDTPLCSAQQLDQLLYKRPRSSISSPCYSCHKLM